MLPPRLLRDPCPRQRGGLSRVSAEMCEGLGEFQTRLGCRAYWEDDTTE